MSIIYKNEFMKRQISDPEKQILLNKHHRSDGKIYCFVDNEPIDDENSIQFDHIEPYAKSEDSSLDNMAPVCKNHNLAKKDMSLSEYRDKLSIEKLFKSKEEKGKQLKLNDVLESKFNSEYGFVVKYEYDDTNEVISLKYFSDSKQI